MYDYGIFSVKKIRVVCFSRLLLVFGTLSCL